MISVHEVDVALPQHVLEELRRHVGAAEFGRCAIACVNPDARVVCDQLAQLHGGIVARPRRVTRRPPHVRRVIASRIIHGETDECRPYPVRQIEETRERCGVDEVLRVIRGKDQRRRAGHRHSDRGVAAWADTLVGRKPRGQFLCQERLPLVGQGAALSDGRLIPIGVEAGLSAYRHHHRQPGLVEPLKGRGVDVPTVEIVLCPQAVKQIDRVLTAALELHLDVTSHGRRRHHQVLHRKARPRERGGGAHAYEDADHGPYHRRDKRGDRQPLPTPAQFRIHHIGQNAFDSVTGSQFQRNRSKGSGASQSVTRQSNLASSRTPLAHGCDMNRVARRGYPQSRVHPQIG